jgi:accessory gene regulator protein AgrB
MPCPYAFALGIPGQGVHAARVLGMALHDWLATFVLAAIVAWLFKANFLYTLVYVFVFGELLHYFYGVPTAFLKMIHLEPDCS